MNDAAVGRVREALDRHGILPAHDPTIPSVSNLVAGRPIRGSWWGDPAGRQIYLVLNALGDDVAWPKLLAGKVTLVHRRLWGALAAVGEQDAPWQTGDLGEVERAALVVVREHGTVKSDALGIPSGVKPGKVVTELERRLLVIADQEHTEAGHHERTVRTWSAWLSEPRPSLGEAVAALEQAADTLSARAMLPWVTSG
ncbi:MAG: hypothetical protein ABMB14_06575 [Myxococcota bacterium]